MMFRWAALLCLVACACAPHVPRVDGADVPIDSQQVVVVAIRVLVLNNAIGETDSVVVTLFEPACNDVIVALYPVPRTGQMIFGGGGIVRVFRGGSGRLLLKYE